MLQALSTSALSQQLIFLAHAGNKREALARYLNLQ
jgi:hypothetical protein